MKFSNFDFDEKFWSKAAALLALTIICLAAGYLRFASLGAHRLWMDEKMMYFSSKKPVATIMKDKWFIDEKKAETPEPPLAALLGKLFLGDFPKAAKSEEGRFLYRFPFALAGVLSVVFAYLLGAKAGDRFTGILCAIFTAGLFYPVYYARDARPYSLIILFANGAAWAFLRAVGHMRGRDFAIFSFFLLLLLYTHYFSAFFILAAVCWCIVIFLLKKKAECDLFSREFLKKSAISFVAVFAFFVPWIPAFARAVDQGMRGVPEKVRGSLLLGDKAIEFYHLLVGKWTVGVSHAIGIYVLIILGVIYFLKNNKEAAAMIICWIMIPILLLPFIPGSSLAHLRHIIFCFPAFILLMASGINLIKKAIQKDRTSRVRNFVAFVVTVIIVSLLMLPGLNLMARGMVTKCRGACKEPACVMFIDNCSELQRSPTIRFRSGIDY